MYLLNISLGCLMSLLSICVGKDIKHPLIRNAQISRCELSIQWTPASNGVCPVRYSNIEILTKFRKVSKSTTKAEVKITWKRLAVCDLFLSTYFGPPCNIFSLTTRVRNIAAISVSVNDVTTEAGDKDVYLHCDVSGSYDHYTISWTHQISGKIIRTISSDLGDNLLFPITTIADAGRYICVVNFTNCNDNGTVEQPAYLYVKGPPTFLSKNVMFNWTEHEEEYANFSFLSDPEPTNVKVVPVGARGHFPTFAETYGYNKELVEASVYGKVVQITGYVVFYKAYMAKYEFKGFYCVEVENELGKTNMTFEIQVDPIPRDTMNIGLWMVILQWLGIGLCPVVVILLVTLGVMYRHSKKREAKRKRENILMAFSQLYALENMDSTDTDMRVNSLGACAHTEANICYELQQPTSDQTNCKISDDGYMLPNCTDHHKMDLATNAGSVMSDEHIYSEIDDIIPASVKD